MPSLLRQIQSINEYAYNYCIGVNFEHYIIGRDQFQHLSRWISDASKLSGCARVFLRIANERLFLSIYYHHSIIKNLENNDPRNGLSEQNITAFIIFIEEINHAFHAALKFKEGRTQNIISEQGIRDLELLSKIDTYLLLKYFVARFNESNQLENLDRLWIKYHLFERQDFDYENAHISQRYYEASYLGERYIRFLDALPIVERKDELTRFRQLPYADKSDYIRMLPC